MELERHLIGFSLSCCIRDICEGRVDIKEVLFIQTGCAPKDEQDLTELLEDYAKSYWRNYKDEALKAIDILRTDRDHPRIGWCSKWQKNCVPIYWGHWLSIQPPNFTNLKTLISGLTDEERLGLWESYCKYCGSSNNPRCQCWNDE